MACPSFVVGPFDLDLDLWPENVASSYICLAHPLQHCIWKQLLLDLALSDFNNNFWQKCLVEMRGNRKLIYFSTSPVYRLCTTCIFRIWAFYGLLAFDFNVGCRTASRGAYTVCKRSQLIHRVCYIMIASNPVWTLLYWREGNLHTASL